MKVAVAAANGRVIHKHAIVAAPPEAVWGALTTRDGVRTYFSPDAKIEATPGGAYEIYFHVFREDGRKGGEGCRVMIVDPPRHFRHTWNAPPSLPSVRHQQTVVDWYLEPVGVDQTRVDLYHYGWELGGEWDDAYRYFRDAWQIIMDRLAERFRVGPVDWEPILTRWRTDLASEQVDVAPSA